MEFNGDADFMGKEDLPWLYEETRRNTPHVIVAFWISMSRQDYRGMLKDITAPCLVTFGRESNYYPPENSAYLKDHIPQARVIPFEGCGHALHIQNPEKFNKEAIAFLNEPNVRLSPET
jgi:non-heme chloroperoxidase